MNKLRAFVVGGVFTLALFTVLTVLQYGITPDSRTGYLTAVVAIALLPVIPLMATYGKHGIRRLAEYHRNGGGLSFERKSIFVSSDTVSDTDRMLSDIEAAVEDTGEYDECRRDRFGEGRGLTIRHTGFHNSFIRVSGGSRLVVTGASENTHSLASLVEQVGSVTMERTRTHPFFDLQPIRGAPRAFLGLFLVVLFVFGVSGVAAAAYPADAYSAPERVVLVSYDSRVTLVPGYDTTDATLDKAAFLVGSLEEEAVEIEWDRDDVSKLETHTQQSRYLSVTIAEMLASTRESGLTATERDRIVTLESDLHAAECRVASAITTRIDSGNVEGDISQLERDGAALRERAATAGMACVASS